MGFLDKVKAQAEQAAAKAKEGVGDVQAKRELAHVYGELGEKTFELIERGELSHTELEPLAERIRKLKQQLEPTIEPVAATTTTEPPPSDQPPAMPT